MDLQMPIMNSLKLQIHPQYNEFTNPDYRTYYVTVDVEKCKSIGMNDYISKPLDEKLLYTKILDVLKS
jgi:CheY-like chemotaxis protein